MLTKSSNTARPRKPSSTVRNPSTVHMTRRRSSRSTSAPLIKEKSSHGSCCAKAIPATRTGSRVREATSSGPATIVTPSPRFDTVLAVHSFLYSGPRPLLAKLLTSRLRSGDTVGGEYMRAGSRLPGAKHRHTEANSGKGQGLPKGLHAGSAAVLTVSFRGSNLRRLTIEEHEQEGG